MPSGTNRFQGNAHNLPLRGRFDVVVMSDLIGYLDDVQAAFENARACMTPNSRLLVSFFNPPPLQPDVSETTECLKKLTLKVS
jgi:SAM-dependent methyltransferase